MKALIIGCGRIAGGFNQDDEGHVLTHALAYRRLGAEIAGCVDRDETRARRFAERWQVAHHGSDLAAVLAASAPDVVSLSTPPEAREATLDLILKTAGVRAILIEKPLALTAMEARRLRERARQAGIPLLVNYIRAFDPFYLKLEQDFRAGTAGRYCSGTARYYGTAKNNASHWLERVFALMGWDCTAGVLGGTKEAPMFELRYGGQGSIQFLPSPDSDFSPFELDLLFERRRWRIVDSERRAERFHSRPDPLFPTFCTLTAQPDEDGMVPSHESILHAVEATLRAAEQGGSEWRALLDRAVAVVECLERIQSAS